MMLSRLHQLCLGTAIISTVTGFIPNKGSINTLTSSSSRSSSSSSHLAGTSDRAHFERKFEDMMDNDWRAFRAKLVAQEAQGGIPTTPRHPSNAEDRALERHSQLTDIFSKSIISIFDKNGSNQQAPSKPTQTTSSGGGGRRMLYKDAIFAGKVTPAPTRATRTDSESTVKAPEYNMIHSYEDPFVSPAELPMFLRETKINKHRWAHPIPHVEPGCVLVANEKLGGVFHQTVVLIVQHCDRSGSVGIVINRPFEGDLLKVATEKQSSLDLSLKLAFSKSPVTYGGPVLPEEYSILHGFGAVEGATKLCPGVYVGGSEALMNEVRINRLDPKKALFVQGHAAWVPGQLSKEIQKGVWYTAAASSDLLLRYAGAQITEEDNPNDLWADILSCMGGQYSEISRLHQGQGDMRMP